MASTADLAFHLTQVVDEMTHLGFTNVALITPTGTTWGIQGDRGGVTSGLKFVTRAPVDAELLHQTIKRAGYHEDRGLVAGYERVMLNG